MWKELNSSPNRRPLNSTDTSQHNSSASQGHGERPCRSISLDDVYRTARQQYVILHGLGETSFVCGSVAERSKALV